MNTTDLALDLGKKTDFLMDCQEMTGVKFDIEAAKELYGYCVTEMSRIEQEIEPLLPSCDLNKGDLKEVTPPVRQMKAGKDGQIPSSYSEKFFDTIEMNEQGQWIATKDGVTVTLPCPQEPLYTQGPMKLKHQAKLKEWIVDQGWIPTLWNEKDINASKPEEIQTYIENYLQGDDKLSSIRRSIVAEKRGKSYTDKISNSPKYLPTTPKFHKAGQMCPNLEALGDKIELIKPIVRWLSIRNRRSVIWNPDKGTGWLANPRLKVDGRLPAGRGGVTNTLRQKHSVVANIPRPASTLGEEMRDLFTCEEGKVLVGYDASSLEAYIKGHYAFPYPGGKEYFAKITDPDYDEHQETADSWGLSSRQDAKAGNYGLQYNQQPPGLARTYNVSLQEAQTRWNLYWENNKPYKLCLDKLEKHWEQMGKKGIFCYTTGYYLHSRSKHSLGSLLIQHTGAVVMDISGIFMDKWLGGIRFDDNGIPYYLYKGEVIKRVLYYHDEYAWECNPEIAEEILTMGINSIKKAGEYLKLNVPLDADGSIGNTWKDIH